MDRIQRTQDRSRLGRLLIEKGIISEAQLDRAIAQQRQSGQKLGEILTEWNIATQRQINGVLRRQRHMRVAAAVATALLGPIQAFAAAPAPVSQISATQSASRTSGGLQARSEDEMGDISAQGITQDALMDIARHSKDGDGLEVVKDLAKLMNPVLQMLESESTMKDVVYDPENARAVVNKDGSVTLRLPSSIGELSFRNIRVQGDTSGGSLGSIVIRGIDLRGSSITVATSR